MVLIAIKKIFLLKKLKDCDEAFVTGTFAGIIPVSQLENKKLFSISSKSLTNHIRDLYRQI